MNPAPIALALSLVMTAQAHAQDPASSTDPRIEPSTTAPAPDASEAPVVPPPTDRNYVAVIIGLSSYLNLPDEVELDYARSDAATVAKALKEQAHFTHIYLLGDGEATRAAFNELMRSKVAQVVSNNDVFVLYYAGHGIGAQVGTPYLLAHDSTIANAQEDAFDIRQLAQDLQTWTPAGTALIVTDAIHRNQLDGFYFHGPSATDWPRMPEGTMLISSSPSQIAAKDGAFGPVFAAAMGGAADANRDRMVTASELFTFLVNRLSPSGQIPVAAGDFNGNLVLANDVEAPQDGTNEPAETTCRSRRWSADIFCTRSKICLGCRCRTDSAMSRDQSDRVLTVLLCAGIQGRPLYANRAI